MMIYIIIKIKIIIIIIIIIMRSFVCVHVSVTLFPSTPRLTSSDDIFSWL